MECPGVSKGFDAGNSHICRTALGYLRSYSFLIRHESDYLIFLGVKSLKSIQINSLGPGILRLFLTQEPLLSRTFGADLRTIRQRNAEEL